MRTREVAFLKPAGWKGGAFPLPFHQNSNIKSVVATGESRFRIVLSAKENGYSQISMVEDFSVAVELASFIAKEGDCVLLSPACSSFDKFRDFEERGNKFIQLVENFNEKLR